MAEQCGPWTLEQLDLFSTSIDALPFSLDSTVWDTACFREATGVISGAGAVNAVGSATYFTSGSIYGTGTLFVAIGGKTYEVAADISAFGNVQSSVTRIINVSGSITSSATVQTAADRLRVIYGAITAAASFYSNFGFLLPADAEISATGTLTELSIRIRDTIAPIRSSAGVTAILYKYGEEWLVVPDDANTWTQEQAQDNTWSIIADSSNTWIPNTSQSDTWTKQTSDSNAWQQIG